MSFSLSKFKERHWLMIKNYTTELYWVLPNFWEVLKNYLASNFKRCTFKWRLKRRLWLQWTWLPMRLQKNCISTYTLMHISIACSWPANYSPLKNCCWSTPPGSSSNGGYKSVLYAHKYINIRSGRSLKAHCHTRFQLTACCCVYKEFTLVGSNQRYYLKNAITMQ